MGTDHGYVPIYLVETKKIPSAIAMDINEGPLLRAQQHIRDAGLGEYIQTRRSDGADALRPGEADTLILAGMGGPLMERILTQGRLVLEDCREFILQPQSEIREFRKYLQMNGFRIEQEDMVQEDGKFYPILRAVHGRMDWEREIDFRFGKLLLEQRHPVLREFLEREQRVNLEIRERLAESESGAGRSRLAQMEEELNGLLASGEALPAVIVYKENGEMPEETEKWKTLTAWMEEGGYGLVFENEGYQVYMEG